MIQVSKRLNKMLLWSDKIGSDEIDEINELINFVSDTQLYTVKEMEKSFIAGGKLGYDINNDSFDEFINKLNDTK